MVIQTNYRKDELKKKANEALALLRSSKILKNERFTFKGEAEAFGIRKQNSKSI